VVVFADRKDLGAVILQYLHDDEARNSMERKALQFALRMQSDLASLESAIVTSLHDKYFADL
jgi:hypothetical protein